MMSIEEKINNDKYIPDFPLNENSYLYWNVAKDLKNSFKIDLFAELGVTDKDRANELFDVLDKTASNPYTNTYYRSMCQMFSDIWRIA